MKKISELDTKSFLGASGATANSYVLINYEDATTSAPITYKASINELGKAIASDLQLYAASGEGAATMSAGNQTYTTGTAKNFVTSAEKTKIANALVANDISGLASVGYVTSAVANAGGDSFSITQSQAIPEDAVQDFGASFGMVVVTPGTASGVTGELFAVGDCTAFPINMAAPFATGSNSVDKGKNVFTYAGSNPDYAGKYYVMGQNGPESVHIGVDLTATYDLPSDITESHVRLLYTIADSFGVEGQIYAAGESEAYPINLALPFAISDQYVDAGKNIFMYAGDNSEYEGKFYVMDNGSPEEISLGGIDFISQLHDNEDTYSNVMTAMDSSDVFHLYQVNGSGITEIPFAKPLDAKEFYSTTQPLNDGNQNSTYYKPVVTGVSNGGYNPNGLYVVHDSLSYQLAPLLNIPTFGVDNSGHTFLSDSNGTVIGYLSPTPPTT